MTAPVRKPLPINRDRVAQRIQASGFCGAIHSDEGYCTLKLGHDGDEHEKVVARDGELRAVRWAR